MLLSFSNIIIIWEVDEGMWDIDGIILTGEKPKLLDQKPFPARPHDLFHHKSHTLWPGTEPRPSRREAGD